ncbi:MAG: iron ABC transporter permease [Andreesenia angusta]|nr:iron ABC transporter permease [Andreesenia angusta]
MVKIDKKSLGLKYIIIAIIPIILFFISINIGRYSVSLTEFFQLIGNKFLGRNYQIEDTIDTVIFNIRIPRVIVAIFVGASLSVSGAAYQGMFKNPMVSPDILGASAGAGFGAALGILLSFNQISIQIISFSFGLIAVFLTYFISSRFGRSTDTIFLLILGGMLVGSLFQAFISLTKYVADPDEKLPAITFWLMGSLSSVRLSDILAILIPFIIGFSILFVMRWKMNVMSFGEEEAKTLGINTDRVRIAVILASTLLTSASVSRCGLIGWVGLVVPHLARMVFGPNFKYLIPASALMGGTYLLIVDNLARTMAKIEIPLGILTAIVGAPFFIYLLMRARKGW